MPDMGFQESTSSCTSPAEGANERTSGSGTAAAGAEPGLGPPDPQATVAATAAAASPAKMRRVKRRLRAYVALCILSMPQVSLIPVAVSAKALSVGRPLAPRCDVVLVPLARR